MGQHACTTRYLMKFKWTWSMLIIRVLGVSNSFFRCYGTGLGLGLRACLPRIIFFLRLIRLISQSQTVLFEIMNSDHFQTMEYVSIKWRIILNYSQGFEISMELKCVKLIDRITRRVQFRSTDCVIERSNAFREHNRDADQRRKENNDEDWSLN